MIDVRQRVGGLRMTSNFACFANRGDSKRSNRAREQALIESIRPVSPTMRREIQGGRRLGLHCLAGALPDQPRVFKYGRYGNNQRQGKKQES